MVSQAIRPQSASLLLSSSSGRIFPFQWLFIANREWNCNVNPCCRLDCRTVKREQLQIIDITETRKSWRQIIAILINIFWRNFLILQYCLKVLYYHLMYVAVRSSWSDVERQVQWMFLCSVANRLCPQFGSWDVVHN